tara:strand:- start:126303 stop:128153 length:1851 start_codon:yes stop_codon:yes gene_type:complete
MFHCDQTYRVRFLMLVSITIFLWPARPSQAQRGEFIEGLFRTIAEAQLERERDKRAAEQRERKADNQAAGSRTKDPYEVRLPSGFDRGGRPPATPPVPTPPQSQRPFDSATPLNPNLRPPGPRDPTGARAPAGPRGSINVRSREAAEFAGNLVQFNSNMESLVRDLRLRSSQQIGLRQFLPEAYAVAAEGQALVRQCDGLSSLRPIIDPYRQLDARWRQLSFELRSSGQLGNTSGALIRQCDQMCSAMARQLEIQPQLDRHALHDLMIQAATYMQVLLDDIELSSIASKQSRQLAHDCRLLRQRLLGEADHVDEASYEDIVSRFSDFARRWSEFSQRVYAVDQPYLNRRLDRIGQCGDQTYALLWMPPPTSSNHVPMIAHRLERNFDSVQDQLTLRAMSSLRRDEQLRVLESSRNLYEKARQLETASEKGASIREQQSLLTEILRGWGPLRETLQRIESLNYSTLAEIDRSCEQLRASLGVNDSIAGPVDVHSLLQAAASLEGASEYLDADLQRYARYLQPDSYRKSLLNGSQEFHHHAKELHALLSQGGAGLGPNSIGKLQREAERMLDGWEILSRELAHLDHHGLSSSRAQRITRSQQELVPFVAQVAAALLER